MLDALAAWGQVNPFNLTKTNSWIWSSLKKKKTHGSYNVLIFFNIDNKKKSTKKIISVR